jgi:hypothetical protein
LGVEKEVVKWRRRGKGGGKGEKKIKRSRRFLKKSGFRVLFRPRE